MAGGDGSQILIFRIYLMNVDENEGEIFFLLKE